MSEYNSEGLLCDLSSFYASLNLPRSFSLACPIICGQQWVTISVQVNNIHKGISGLVFVAKEGSVGNYTLTTWSLSELLGQKLIIDEIWHNWRFQICQYDFRIMTTLKWIWKTNPFSSQGFKNVWHFKDAHRRPFAIRVSMNQWLQVDETGSDSGLNYRTVNQLFACFISALWFLLVINFHYLTWFKHQSCLVRIRNTLWFELKRACSHHQIHMLKMMLKGSQSIKCDNESSSPRVCH